MLRAASIGLRISFYDETLIQLLVITSPLFPLIIEWMHRSPLGKVASGIDAAIFEYTVLHYNAFERVYEHRKWVAGGVSSAYGKLSGTRRIIGNTGSQSERNSRKT